MWTDALAMGMTEPSTHANPDFVPASALSGDLQSRYLVVEPDVEDDDEDL
jgi:hypothetical protein